MSTTQTMELRKSLTRTMSKKMSRPFKVVRVSVISVLLPLLFACFIAPLLLYFFPQIMQHLFFLNFRRMPMIDYDNVTSNGVKSVGRSFHLNGEDGRIGVWHVLPQSFSSSNMLEDEMESFLSNKQYPVILYAHGNSFDRTASHRCELYNVLSEIGLQIISFDYRGYGDSEGSPTEEGLVADARTVYEYIKQHSEDNSIFIWGHSMGTGVCTRLTKELSVEGRAPNGIILESPFNNLRDAVMNHPFSLPIRWMTNSMVDKLVMIPLRSVGLVMESDVRIAHVSCPILLLHAQDDHVIPVKLARLLRVSFIIDKHMLSLHRPHFSYHHRLVTDDAAIAASRDIEYIEFDSERSLAHKFIYTAQELPHIVTSFISRCGGACEVRANSSTKDVVNSEDDATSLHPVPGNN